MRQRAEADGPEAGRVEAAGQRRQPGQRQRDRGSRGQRQPGRGTAGPEADGVSRQQGQRQTRPRCPPGQRQQRYMGGTGPELSGDAAPGPGASDLGLAATARRQGGQAPGRHR